MNKSKIIGILLTLWGTAILVNSLVLKNVPEGNVAYKSGQGVALLLAAGFVIGGLLMIFKKKPETRRARLDRPPIHLQD